MSNFSAIENISYPGLNFVLKDDNGRPYLQIQAEVPCSFTGRLEMHSGRKWFLSPHMTRSEVVQTALMAVLAWEEHEVREKFKYRDKAIFGPHFNVDQLFELASAKAFDLRKKAIGKKKADTEENAELSKLRKSIEEFELK